MTCTSITVIDDHSKRKCQEISMYKSIVIGVLHTLETLHNNDVIVPRESPSRSCMCAVHDDELETF